jgi:N4-gp56 family major capsid protein
METISTIPHAVNNWYDRMLLERLTPLLVHDRFAQIRDIPKNNTNVIKFRRYNSLDANTTALTEGETPEGTSLSVTDVTATVLQYGDYVTISDYLQLTTLDPILLETAAVLGEQAGLSLDNITRDVLNAGTSVAYSGSGHTARDEVNTGDVIDEDDIEAAVLAFKNANVKKITKMVAPDAGYETRPINASYVGIVHPEIAAEIKGFTGFVPIEKYASQADVMPGEFGSYFEVRFIETSNAKVFEDLGASSIDVYSTVIIGDNAYGVTRIAGESLKNIVKPLGSAGTSDPLNQRATSGWKATKVAKILNEDCVYRIESAKV